MEKYGVHPNLKGFEEAFTGYCATIGSDHAYIHAGIGFSIPIVITALAAGSDYKVAFTTPAETTGKYLHWRPAFFSSSANSVRYQLIEGSVFTGGSPVKPVNRNRNSTGICSSTVYVGATAALAGVTAVAATAGGNFANQPGGGKVTVVSGNAADIGQKVTVYGTKTGATTTVTTEVITLNGTTAVDSVTTTWQNILGIELDAVCAGTVTIKNAAAATITTLLTTVLSAGVATIAVSNARNQIVRHDASGAATTPVGIIGTDCNGDVISSVDALNGTTEEDHNTDIFNTLTKVLIGAVASSVNVNIVIPERVLSTMSVGSGSASSRSGGNTGSDLEMLLHSGTNYVLYFKNIGSSTATDIDVEMFFYEEGRGL
jgi:hypothetical protein